MTTPISQSEVLSPDGHVIDISGAGPRSGESLTRLAMRRLSRDYLTLIALGILAILVILALSAGLISEALDVSYRRTNIGAAFLPIGAEGHVLGTDDIGRDHLARLLYGGRVSLGIAFAAGLISLTIGVSFGLLAGFYQGSDAGIKLGPFKLRGSILDDLLMWFITTLNSVPYIFLLLVVSAILAPKVTSFILLLGFLSWPGTMRLVRGETLSHREREYVLAARTIGAGNLRIMFSHILPNIFSVLIINLALDIGAFILIEAALSYLNLGVRPPTPSWGNMLINAQIFYTRGVHLFIMPGALIVTTVLCLYLIGDGLRDAFDPQSQKGR